MNEKGMVLPSVMVMMMILAALLTGTAFIARNQVQQLTLTQDSYKVKSMVELSRTVLLETVEKENVQQMTVTFEEGRVDITRKDDVTYQAVGYLDKGTSYQTMIPIDAKIEEEETAEPSPEKEPSIEKEQTEETQVDDSSNPASSIEEQEMKDSIDWNSASKDPQR